jgi:hypothetical protein
MKEFNIKEFIDIGLSFVLSLYYIAYVSNIRLSQSF